MVGVMRTLLAAFAFVLAVCAAPQGLAQERDLSGVWSGSESESTRVGGGYFTAQLTQDEAGRLSGTGVVDPCPRCAGFMEYDLTWQGELKGETLILTGTPERVGGRHTVVRFEGRATSDGFRGALTGLVRGGAMRVTLLRERNGAVTEEAPAESR